MKPQHYFLVIFIAFIGQSCRKDVVDDYEKEQPLLPATVYNYQQHQYPQHFKDDPLLNLIMGFSDDNPITNEGATLGRVLFYDKKLSANVSVSCSSCHLQEKGFSDGARFSKGFEDGLTDRNSMAIVNSDLQSRLFWDRRSNSIEEQALQPIEHPIEMGMELTNLELRLSKTSYYAELFNAAFGDEQITAERIALAIGQFIRSIRSYRTKYDQGVPQDFANFTADELAGKDLFFSGENACANCHFTQNFGGVSPNINGLNTVYADEGIGKLTNEEKDKGRFKTVTLRNILLTAPYMHDGRFETIDDVLGFYSNDIQPHPYLDARLTVESDEGGTPKQLNFTADEIRQFKAFFGTLTDVELINDPGFSDPFKH